MVLEGIDLCEEGLWNPHQRDVVLVAGEEHCDSKRASEDVFAALRDVTRQSKNCKLSRAYSYREAMEADLSIPTEHPTRDVPESRQGPDEYWSRPLMVPFEGAGEGMCATLGSH